MVRPRALPSRTKALGMSLAVLTAGAALSSAACVAPTLDEAPTYEQDAVSGSKADGDDKAGAPVVYRLSDVRVREPHFFVRPFLSCSDLTDEGAFGEPSINEVLNSFVSEDDPSEPDGFLDLSLLLLFRPLDAQAPRGQLDFGAGECSSPAASTECDLDSAALPSRATLVNQSSGQCLDADSGHLSPAAYSPPPSAVAGPCFATEPFDTTLRLGLVALPLRDVTIAATYQAAGIGGGSLRGFLTERDADARRLPPELPVVGGEPISAMFPGGTSNCAKHDDRDLHDGDRGWWIYVDFTVEQIDYVGP
jgi:hypothetical protein